MKKDSKRENKVAFILYTITAALFIISGISILICEGLSDFTPITNLALGVTFGFLVVMYYKKYKSE